MTTMISYADTSDINSISKEIKELSSEFNAEIEALFQRFARVAHSPNPTAEWTGQKAQEYFKIIQEDKRQYQELARAIRKIGVELNWVAESLEENIINSNR